LLGGACARTFSPQVKSTLSKSIVEPIWAIEILIAMKSLITIMRWLILVHSASVDDPGPENHSPDGRYRRRSMGALIVEHGLHVDDEPATARRND